MPASRIDSESSEQAVDAPVEQSATEDSDPRKLLVSFRSRAACTVIDLFAVMFIVGLSGDALGNANWAIAKAWADSGPALAGILVLYFTVFWASPLGATPVQFLWGIRVVGYDGKRLPLWRSLLRSALLVVLTTGALTVFETIREPQMMVVTLFSIGLLFIAALTPYRQAAHDLLMRSLVVDRQALGRPGSSELLRAVDDRGPLAWRTGVRFRLSDLLLNTMTLVIPLALLLQILQFHHARDMNLRISYAFGESSSLRTAVGQFQREHGKFPADARELGVPPRVHYPDGGYYELLADGAVQIRFTVLPGLKGGWIILTPRMDNGGLTWRCSVGGAFDPDYSPSACRY